MVANLISKPLRDDRLHIIVEDRARYTAERQERFPMTIEEGFDLLIEGKAYEYLSRPSERHDEGA